MPFTLVFLTKNVNYYDCYQELLTSIKVVKAQA